VHRGGDGDSKLGQPWRDRQNWLSKQAGTSRNSQLPIFAYAAYSMLENDWFLGFLASEPSLSLIGQRQPIQIRSRPGNFADNIVDSA
jgi:hypothetical protein